MIDNKKILHQLRTLKPFLLSEFGVKEIGLFGSFAKNQANDQSDIDLLVTLENPGFLKFVHLVDFLEEKLAGKVDITTKHNNLSRNFLNQVEKEIIYA